VFIRVACHAALAFVLLSCGGTTAIPADGGVAEARNNDAGASDVCIGAAAGDATFPCITPPVDALPPPPVD
jgi:hypothetical protein